MNTHDVKIKNRYYAEELLSDGYKEYFTINTKVFLQRYKFFIL